jgi:hypothetical protein
LLLDLARDFQPAQTRHGDVHDDNIRLGLLAELQGLLTVFSLTDDLNIRVRAEQHPQARSYDFVIVH